MQLADSALSISMVNYNNRLFCRLDEDLTPAARQQKQLATLKKLGLLETELVPVFDEATQTVANYLKAPVCFLGLMLKDQLWLKSAAGLSSIGLMNQLAVSRKLPRNESFCTYVVDSENFLVINDTITNSVFASTILVQHYGIRAYLGAPLITADGQCLGTMAVMDLEPRQFSKKDMEFLAMTARWCLSEYERNLLLKQKPVTPRTLPTVPGQLTYQPEQPSMVMGELEEPAPLGYRQGSMAGSSGVPNTTDAIKVKLLAQLTQELRTPLTSVMGMARVLGREVYGPLTNKQKEYLDVIHNSGQHLLTLVEEIVNLDVLDQDSQRLHLSPVDIEMLCQQAFNNLSHLAQEHKQEIRLSVEPGNRIWLLDKDKVRQAIYYLVVSVIESAEPGSEVRIHVSRKLRDFSSNMAMLSIAVWVSHPWLGDGLPQIDRYSDLVRESSSSGMDLNESTTVLASSLGSDSERQVLDRASLVAALREAEQVNDRSGNNRSRELLGLLLSCHLTQMHNGEIIVQGSLESGYRYMLNLPQMSEESM